MSIIFFGSKLNNLALKNEAHFLVNETNFKVKWRGGGGEFRIVSIRQKMSTIYFAPTPNK